VQSGVIKRIEARDVFVVERPFEVDGVAIAAGDLVAYRRKDAGNDFNAATMFRHLQRMR
jgi:hypothetical protein